MTDVDVTLIIAGVIAGAAPIVLAAIGETITEKSGMINLSLDGSILLAAMAAFVVALKTESLPAGFAAGALVGAAVAAVVAVFSIFLGQNQVAVGFVLTLMAKDLAYFLGNPYSRLPGPHALSVPIPGLEQIPFLGPVLFN
ncbi:MAG: ABC transporter permease, partial [Desulfobacteraceae bacterium]